MDIPNIAGYLSVRPADQTISRPGALSTGRPQADGRQGTEQARVPRASA
ncbi:hypothetical protein FAGKG844_90012 [Frankia sp. AgKG'84/4]